MAIALDVENQRFSFGDTWTLAFKYDDTTYYHDGPERLKDELTCVDPNNQCTCTVGLATKAVDIVALHARDGLLLLEAKDFRGYRIENKDRIQRGELPVEVALKVRDTVAGIVGAGRKHVDEFKSGDLLNAMQPNTRMMVVLWIEDDMLWREGRRSKLHLQSITGKLKEKLTWLNVRPMVLSSQSERELPDLQVTNLAGVGQPNH